MDEDLIEKKQSSELIFDGNLLKVYKDKVELPNGNPAYREWIKHPGASAVIPVLPNGDVIFIRQYRYPVRQVVLEVPAGKLDIAGEDPLECAKRELKEETGYTAEKYTKLTTIATTVGFSDEYIHIYAAEELTAGEQCPDSDEFLNVVKLPLTTAVEYVRQGKIFDAKSIAAIMLLKDTMKK